jgi:hypothetical protein
MRKGSRVLRFDAERGEIKTRILFGTVDKTIARQRDGFPIASEWIFFEKTFREYQKTLKRVRVPPQTIPQGLIDGSVRHRLIRPVRRRRYVTIRAGFRTSAALGPFKYAAPFPRK